MELLREQEVDSLEALEERIRRAVDLVTRLRREKDAAIAERDSALREAAEARGEASRISEELETLQAERKQVRNRIEKLLGQIDSLGVAS